MTDTRNDDGMLDLFFAAGRAAAPEPSAELIARIAQAGLALQPVPAPVMMARPAQERPRGGFVGALLNALGGWGGLGGMATAAAAGLWIGLAGSDLLSQVAGGLGDTTVSASAGESGLSLLGDGDILALAAN